MFKKLKKAVTSPFRAAGQSVASAVNTMGQPFRDLGSGLESLMGSMQPDFGPLASALTPPELPPLPPVPTQVDPSLVASMLGRRAAGSSGARRRTILTSPRGLVGLNQQGQKTLLGV